MAAEFKKENRSERGKEDSVHAAYGATAQGYDTQSTLMIVWHLLDYVSDDDQ